MIRCRPPPGTTLEALIDAHAPASGRRKSWRAKAAAHTTKLRKKRAFTDQGAPDWGDIKSVYAIEVQGRKCAYCEKPLETDEISLDRTAKGPNLGAVEQDIEHFRPKNAVKHWDPGSSIKFPIGAGTSSGYYLLAYDLWNYCVACKTCNSTLKACHFPIEGQPGRSGASHIGDLNATEQPLLFYPIADVDDDPEAYIGFVGYAPTTKVASGRGYRRAAASIRFFKLDVRDSLLRERSNVIVSMFRALCDMAETQNPRRQADGARTVARLTDSHSPHANCARCYRALFLADPDQAYAIFQNADAYAFRGKASG